MRGISTIFNMKRYEWGMAIIWILYSFVRSLEQDLISNWKDTSYDHLYVPLFVNTSNSPSFPHSWLITEFVTRLTQRVSLKGQELITLPEYLRSPPVFSVVRVIRSLVICVCYVDRCMSFCPFFFLPLCCLFFYLRILNSLLVSSNSSQILSL